MIQKVICGCYLFQVSTAWGIGLIVGPAIGGYFAQVIPLQNYCKYIHARVIRLATCFCPLLLGHFIFRFSIEHFFLYVIADFK